jgi:hypothetical protein
VRLVRILVGRLLLVFGGVRMLLSVRLGNVFEKFGCYLFVSSHCEPFWLSAPVSDELDCPKDRSSRLVPFFVPAKVPIG